jgi:cell division protein ZapA (FtsZ GTPase activity inhibitor)
MRLRQVLNKPCKMISTRMTKLTRYIRIALFAALAVMTPIAVTSCLEAGTEAHAKLTNVVKTTDAVLSKTLVELDKVEQFLTGEALTTVEAVESALKTVKAAVGSIAAYLGIDLSVAPTAAGGKSLSDLTKDLDKEIKKLE